MPIGVIINALSVVIGTGIYGSIVAGMIREERMDVQMKIKTAAIQMHTVPDKMENIRTAGAYIEKVSAQKPDFVILPEMFCCPYQTENFPVYAEEEGGPAWQAMSGLAEKYQIYLIAGSMPERDADGNIFNTSYIFDRQGKTDRETSESPSFRYQCKRRPVLQGIRYFDSGGSCYSI